MAGTLDHFREDGDIPTTNCRRSAAKEQGKVDKGKGKEVDSATKLFFGMSFMPDATPNITINLTGKPDLSCVESLREIWKEVKFDRVAPSPNTSRLARELEKLEANPSIPSRKVYTNIWHPDEPSRSRSVVTSSPGSPGTFGPIARPNRSDKKSSNSQLLKTPSADPSSSSNMGLIVVKESIAEVEEEDVWSRDDLLEGSIPELEESQPMVFIDSGIGMAPPSSQQSHDSTVVPKLDNWKLLVDDPFTGSGPPVLTIPTGPANLAAGRLRNGHFEPGRDPPTEPTAYRGPACQPMGHFQYDQVKNLGPHTPRSLGRQYQRAPVYKPRSEPRLTIRYVTNVELLALTILSRPGVHGTEMHATDARFGNPVLVSVPTQTLRSKSRSNLHVQLY
jgi:hypothetical protein